MLEPILEIYQPQKERRVLGEFSTSGLEMYTMGINDKPLMPKFSPIGGLGSGFGVLKDAEGKSYGIGREREYSLSEEEIARMFERIRKPETDPTHGNHVNYEEIVPGVKKPLVNIHIPLGDKKKK